MRRSMLVGALVFLSLSTASAQAAPSLGGVRVESVGDDLAVRVLADAPLENARVRTETGHVRVWFSNVVNRPRLEIDGDGRAIRRVGLAPGMEETIVLRIDLGHEVRVPASDIRIEPTPDGCLVHVPTGWLPPAPEATTAATNAATAAASDAANAVNAANTANTANTANNATNTATNATARDARTTGDTRDASDDAIATPNGASDADAPPALGARRDRESPVLGTRPASELPIASLGLIALVLLGAWLYAKKHRRTSVERSDIQILATHRLGPKHQLLVVRALGQDHLLAVHGQTTQVLGTTKPNEERPSTFLSRLREASDERAAPPPPATDENEERFGARLLSLVGGRDASPRQPANAPTSDAVAGILRLKARQESG